MIEKKKVPKNDLIPFVGGGSLANQFQFEGFVINVIIIFYELARYFLLKNMTGKCFAIISHFEIDAGQTIVNEIVHFLFVKNKLESAIRLHDESAARSEVSYILRCTRMSIY